MPCWPKNEKNVKEFQFCAKNPLTMHKISNLAWDFCDGGFVSLAVETAKICLQKFCWRSEKKTSQNKHKPKKGAFQKERLVFKPLCLREHDSFRGEVRFSKNKLDSARILWQLWRSPRWFDDNPVVTETVPVSKVFRSLLKGDYTRFNSTISFFQTKTIFKRSSTKYQKKSMPFCSSLLLIFFYRLNPSFFSQNFPMACVLPFPLSHLSPPSPPGVKAKFSPDTSIRSNSIT